MSSAELIWFVGQLTWHVLPALVVVGAGGFLVNRFFVRKANHALLVDRVCGQLELLSADCAEYWSSDQKNLGCSKSGPLEARIKGRVLHVSAVVGLAEKKYPSKAVQSGLASESLLDLQHRCTGGDFEVSDRKANRAQYLQIVNAINRLSGYMLSRKL